MTGKIPARSAGLIVRCAPDPRDYPKSTTASDAAMDARTITDDAFHPEWNHTVPPGPAIWRDRLGELP